MDDKEFIRLSQTMDRIVCDIRGYSLSLDQFKELEKKWTEIHFLLAVAKRPSPVQEMVEDDLLEHIQARKKVILPVMDIDKDADINDVIRNGIG